MSDEADEAFSVTEMITAAGINTIRQKVNVISQTASLCVYCGEPIPEARLRIFPGVTLCVECQSFREYQAKHYRRMATDD